MKVTTKNIPLPTSFGLNLKSLRRLKGISQTKLAEIIGLTRNNIAAYESGIVEPNASNFLKICAFFKIDPREMLENEISVSEERGENLSDNKNPNSLMSEYIRDEFENFTFETNQATKIIEGYIFFSLNKDQMLDSEESEFRNVQDDIIHLLESLIKTNWSFIQSVYPDDGEGEE